MQRQVYDARTGSGSFWRSRAELRAKKTQQWVRNVERRSAQRVEVVEQAGAMKRERAVLPWGPSGDRPAYALEGAGAVGPVDEAPPRHVATNTPSHQTRFGADLGHVPRRGQSSGLVPPRRPPGDPGGAPPKSRTYPVTALGSGPKGCAGARRTAWPVVAVNVRLAPRRVEPPGAAGRHARGVSVWGPIFRGSAAGLS